MAMTSNKENIIYEEDDEEEEVFFGEVSEKEKRKASKYAKRRTIVFTPGFRNDRKLMRYTMDPARLAALTEETGASGCDTEEKAYADDKENVCSAGNGHVNITSDLVDSEEKNGNNSNNSALDASGDLFDSITETEVKEDNAQTTPGDDAQVTELTNMVPKLDLSNEQEIHQIESFTDSRKTPAIVLMASEKNSKGTPVTEGSAAFVEETPMAELHPSEKCEEASEADDFVEETPTAQLKNTSDDVGEREKCDARTEEIATTVDDKSEECVGEVPIVHLESNQMPMQNVELEEEDKTVSVECKDSLQNVGQTPILSLKFPIDQYDNTPPVDPGKLIENPVETPTVQFKNGINPFEGTPTILNHANGNVEETPTVQFKKPTNNLEETPIVNYKHLEEKMDETPTIQLKTQISDKEETPTVNFKKPDEVVEETPTIQFKKLTSDMEETPTVSFEKPEKNVDETPTVQFKTPIGNGGNIEETPTIQFNKPTNDIEETPIIQFKKPTDDIEETPTIQFKKATEPIFDFRKPAEQETPTVSFKKSEENMEETPTIQFGSLTTDTTETPTVNFKKLDDVKGENEIINGKTISCHMEENESVGSINSKETLNMGTTPDCSSVNCNTKDVLADSTKDANYSETPSVKSKVIPNTLRFDTPREQQNKDSHETPRVNVKTNGKDATAHSAPNSARIGFKRSSTSAFQATPGNTQSIPKPCSLNLSPFGAHHSNGDTGITSPSFVFKETNFSPTLTVKDVKRPNTLPMSLDMNFGNSQLSFDIHEKEIMGDEGSSEQLLKPFAVGGTNEQYLNSELPSTPKDLPIFQRYG